MFYVETQDKKRHKFASEKYARGYLKAIYHEKMFQFEKEPERYEILGKALTDNEFRISVKDKSRLYFLGRANDIKHYVYTAKLIQQIEGVLAS